MIWEFDPFTARFAVGCCIIVVGLLFGGFAMWRP